MSSQSADYGQPAGAHRRRYEGRDPRSCSPRNHLCVLLSSRTESEARDAAGNDAKPIHQDRNVNAEKNDPAGDYALGDVSKGRFTAAGQPSDA